jgi:hypothetical protein
VAAVGIRGDGLGTELLLLPVSSSTIHSEEVPVGVVQTGVKFHDSWPLASAFINGVNVMVEPFG